MLSLFNRQSRQPLPQLPNLDNSLYPLAWQQHLFASPSDLLLAIVQAQAAAAVNAHPNQQQFSKLLQNNPIYQDWINFSVYGRYIQRSFTAFSQQSEDSFNTDMPELLKRELLRHAQRLPQHQVLFLGGQLAPSTRQQKLLITTLNPLTAITNAQTSASKPPIINQNTVNKTTVNQTIVNQITIQSDTVKAFAVKHNQRTRDALRHDVMVLDFSSLVLTQEIAYQHNVSNNHLAGGKTVIRHYNLE